MNREDSSTVVKFLRVFNKAFRKVIPKNKKFSSCRWAIDMTSANFNDLAIIYGEDILDTVMGCEFHFKQSFEFKSLGAEG